MDRNPMKKPESVQDFLDRYVFITRGNLVCDLWWNGLKGVYKLAEFQNHVASVTTTITLASGQPKDVAVCGIWLKHPDRLTCSDLAYLPSNARLVQDQDDKKGQFLNVFHFNDWPEAHAMDRLQPFFDHMTYLFPQEDRRHYFVGWLSHMIQHPGERPTVTPLLLAKAHGTGRGWIGECITAMIGLHNKSSTTMEILAGIGNDGKFQDYMYRTIFCDIGETKASDKRFGIDDKIRDKLTAKAMQLNLKYNPNIQARVYTRFMMQSNHPLEALIIDTEDRRMWVHETTAPPREEEYYLRLYELLKDPDFLGQLFWFLRRYDISDLNFTGVAPMTHEKGSLIGHFVSDEAMFFAELINCLPLDADMMHSSQISIKLQDCRIESKSWHYSLSDLGCRKYTRPDPTGKMTPVAVKYDGKVGGLWILRNYEKYADIPRSVIDEQLRSVENWLQATTSKGLVSILQAVKPKAQKF